MQSDSIVIIPTYNEKENIEKIIRAVFALNKFHILIIDDNSPDGTAAIVEGLIAEHCHDSKKSAKGIYRGVTFGRANG